MKYDDSHKLMNLFESIVKNDPDIVKEVSDIDATGFTDPDELDRQDNIERVQTLKAYRALTEKVMSNEYVAEAVLELLGSFAWFGRKNPSIEEIMDQLKRNEIYWDIDDESRKLIYNICTDTERFARNASITGNIKRDLDDAGMKMECDKQVDEGEKSPEKEPSDADEEDNKNDKDTPNDDGEEVMSAVEYFSKK